MGIRDRYEPGVFCWVDLATTNPEAAKPFYQDLFGWRFEDIPVPDAPPYVMAYKGDRRVAALFTMPAEMQAQQIPPHWQSYINVTDLDAAIASWEQHGGKICAPPCQILDAGRMAVAQDPTGAIAHLWQPENHIGAGVVNETNTYCWPELQTRGANRAAEFYAAVFGWEAEAEDKPPYYISAKVGGRYNCGLFDLDRANLPAEIPPHWEVYFNVANLKESLARVEALGGSLLAGPMTIEQGDFASIADPQGAVCTLIEPTMVDD